MDRRHALPGSPSPPTATPRRSEMGRGRIRAAAQILPNHQGRPQTARRSPATVAGGRQYSSRHLDEAVHHMSSSDASLEEQIAQWRGYLLRRRAIEGPDVDELEGHLKDEVTVLTDAGLAGDEAFLVAVKRLGSLDALSREFARE